MKIDPGENNAALQSSLGYCLHATGDREKGVKDGPQA